MVTNPNLILNHPDVERLILLALDEDGIQNDLTTQAAGLDSPSLKTVRATIVARRKIIIAGYPIVEKILKVAKVQDSIHASSLASEGTELKAASPWVLLEGKASDLLRVERVILNFLMRMSGIATYTRKVVAMLDGTSCRLLHTRKTAPGHRRTDIYAACIGGAFSHRRSLDDAILVKENHLRSVSDFQTLIDGIGRMRSQASFVEIEVTSVTDLKHALMAKPQRIMLDNFRVEEVAKAVQLYSSSVELEASGGITLENVRAYAETGVDFISMGALTHSAPAADLSMEFDFKT